MKHTPLFLLAVIVSLAPLTGLRAEGPRETFQNSLPADSVDVHNRAKLIDLWSNAAHKSPGAEGDEVQVRMIKLPEGLQVTTVRWLSAEAAVAQCEHEQVRYLAFYFKDNGKWVFVRHYSLGKAKK